MSYTLSGRLASRLATLAGPVLVACAIAAAIGEWWPLELAGLMSAVGLAVDLVYDRALAYQPGWVAIPLGLLELGLLMVLVRLLGAAPPLGWALVFFAGSWLWSQVLAHALLPVARMSWAEDGGELGARATSVAALALALPLAGAGGVYRHNLPPVVHLSAGIHQGPIVIDRRERLVGDDGAIVRGGIVVRHRDVTIENVRVVGGEYGIAVLGVRNVELDHVSVSGAKLDGVHVRHASVHLHHCDVNMTGVQQGQGIDISYGLIQGENVVEHCTVVGGRDGISVHGSMGMVLHNRVERTTMTGISMTEMSMGDVSHNTVSNALGIGILCGDHSLCDVDRNTVLGTRRDDGGGNSMRAGFGFEVEFQAEARLSRNDFVANPRTLGVFLGSVVRWR